MEKGSMRHEANVSMREESSEELPNFKIELKNINSFGFLKKAVEFELKRQEELLQNKEKVGQETRGFDERTGKTVLQRIKEEANDYRYFPEPDIPPLLISEEEVKNMKKSIPELPEDKRRKYKAEFDLPANYIEILVDDWKRAEYFEQAALEKIEGITPKDIAGLMVNQNLDKDYPEPALLVKKIYELLKKDYAEDTEAKKAVGKVIASNKKAVDDYKNGKGEVVGFLIGQVQKKLKGKGEPKMVRNMLIEIINLVK